MITLNDPLNERCDHCGARVNMNGCKVCGAPQCCPQCCRIGLLEATLFQFVVAFRNRDNAQSHYRYRERIEDAYGSAVAVLGGTEGVRAIEERVK